MIIAALEINGTTEISNIQFIERGYEDVVEKFRGLGADIKRCILPETTSRSSVPD